MRHILNTRTHQKTNKQFRPFVSSLFLGVVLAHSTFALENTLQRLENNDPTLTSVRFWNFGEPAGKATTRLFKAIATNTHLESIEVSMEAGFGRDQDLGIRLSNACLTNYNTKVAKGKLIRKWQVKDTSVRILAGAIRACPTLRTITFRNALFGHKYRTELGEAIRDNHHLTTVRLEIDLNSTVADLIAGNPSLETLDVAHNVDLTLPENQFISFLRKVHAHPILRELSLEQSGEVYIYRDYLRALELHRLQTPGYHLETLTTGLDLGIQARAKVVEAQEPVLKKKKGVV